MGHKKFYHKSKAKPTKFLEKSLNLQKNLANFALNVNKILNNVY